MVTTQLRLYDGHVTSTAYTRSKLYKLRIYDIGVTDSQQFGGTMKYISVFVVMICALTGVCVCADADADGPYVDDYCAITVMIGDEMVMQNITIVGSKTVGQVVQPITLPDGYIGWDHDLDEVVYEDMTISAVPGPKSIEIRVETIAGLFVLSIVAILLFFILKAEKG